MTRIAILALEAAENDNAPLVGGSAKVPFKLFHALSRKAELNVDYFYFQGESRQARCHKLSALPGKLYLKTLLREIALLFKAPKLFGYDVIQIHHPHFALMLGLIKRVFRLKSKIIVKAHGTALPELKANGYKGLKNIILLTNAYIHLWHDRAGLAFADWVLCSSKFQLKEMQELYRLSADKLRVIYNGYDRQALEQALKTSQKDRHPKSIIMCGRLVPKKNFRYAIELFKELRKHDPSYSMTLICGHKDRIEDPATWAMIEKEALDLPTLRIRFDLDENTLYQEMLSHEIALLPSIGYESIPSVLYEYLASGCRVYANHKWGIVEILPNETRLSFDAAQDAAKIHEADIENKNHTLIKIAEHSYDALTKHYEELYR